MELLVKTKVNNNNIMVDVTTLVIFVALLWTTLKWPIAQTAYEEHQQRLSSDAWVHDQCQDPTFSARSMQHKELCEHTQALFEQSPWWVAMRTCIPTHPPKTRCRVS